MREPGLALNEPTPMSFTSMVPAAVPSLFHSSMPWVAVAAVKNVTDPTSTNLNGFELLVLSAGLMSWSSSRSPTSSRRGSSASNRNPRASAWSAARAANRCSRRRAWRDPCEKGLIAANIQELP